jgi:hypothetical protein
MEAGCWRLDAGRNRAASDMMQCNATNSGCLLVEEQPGRTPGSVSVLHTIFTIERDYWTLASHACIHTYTHIRWASEVQGHFRVD